MPATDAVKMGRKAMKNSMEELVVDFEKATGDESFVRKAEGLTGGRDLFHYVSLLMGNARDEGDKAILRRFARCMVAFESAYADSWQKAGFHGTFVEGVGYASVAKAHRAKAHQWSCLAS